MARKEDILRDQTYKEDGLEADVRVFYTLHDGEKSGTQVHRNSKLIAVLVKALREKGILDDDDIDEILLQCVT